MCEVLIETGVAESDQMGSHQNGTLQTAVDGIAMTIETHISVPGELKTEADIAKHLKDTLSKIDIPGLSFNIIIGEEGE